MSNNNTTYSLGRIGLNIRGEYEVTATYEKLDVVTYNGSSYVALQKAESKNLENAAYWQKLVNGYPETDIVEATEFALRYGASSATNLGNGKLRYRVVGNHVFISGGITAKFTGSSATVAVLPEGARPAYNNTGSLRPATGGRIARIIIDPSGNVILEWIRNISDNSYYTSETWIDCNMDFWTD